MLNLKSALKIKYFCEQHPGLAILIASCGFANILNYYILLENDYEIWWSLNAHLSILYKKIYKKIIIGDIYEKNKN